MLACLGKHLARLCWSICSRRSSVCVLLLPCTRSLAHILVHKLLLLTLAVATLHSFTCITAACMRQRLAACHANRAPADVSRTRQHQLRERARCSSDANAQHSTRKRCAREADGRTRNFARGLYLALTSRCVVRHSGALRLTGRSPRFRSPDRRAPNDLRTHGYTHGQRTLLHSLAERQDKTAA